MIDTQWTEDQVLNAVNTFENSLDNVFSEMDRVLDTLEQWRRFAQSRGNRTGFGWDAERESWFDVCRTVNNCLHHHMTEHGTTNEEDDFLEELRDLVNKHKHLI